MSVRKSDRDKNILQAEIEAKNLAVYTLQMCQNNEIFPKSVRWVLCDRIINACTDLFVSVRKANAVKVTLLENAVLRENYQRAALGKLITLQSLMTLAVDCYNIKSSKFETWSKFYNTTIKYIRAWHNSDKKKHDAMFDRKSIDLKANQKPNPPTESDGIADIVDKELLTPDTAKTVDELQNFSKSKKLF